MICFRNFSFEQNRVLLYLIDSVWRLVPLEMLPLFETSRKPTNPCGKSVLRGAFRHWRSMATCLLCLLHSWSDATGHGPRAQLSTLRWAPHSTFLPLLPFMPLHIHLAGARVPWHITGILNQFVFNLKLVYNALTFQQKTIEWSGSSRAVILAQGNGGQES